MTAHKILGYISSVMFDDLRCFVAVVVVVDVDGVDGSCISAVLRLMPNHY